MPFATRVTVDAIASTFANGAGPTRTEVANALRTRTFATIAGPLRFTAAGTAVLASFSERCVVTGTLQPPAVPCPVRAPERRLCALGRLGDPRASSVRDRYARRLGSSRRPFGGTPLPEYSGNLHRGRADFRGWRKVEQRNPGDHYTQPEYAVNRIYPKVAAIAKPSQTDFPRTLDELARLKVGELIQAVLIEEINEYVRRLRAEADGKAQNAHRDGYEDERTVTYGSLPVTIRRPRVRGVEEPFVSEILPPYRRRFSDVDKALHELWTQGLSTRDFEPSLRALLGEKTPLSSSTISRVNKQFLDEYEAWRKRDLVNDFVYLWADGIYLWSRTRGRAARHADGDWS